MKVWKFPLDQESNRQLITMPQGAKVLCVQMQQNLPTLWALCDNCTGPQVDRVFNICGTGFEVPKDAEYIGTVQDGSCVWHVFEEQLS